MTTIDLKPVVNLLRRLLEEMVAHPGDLVIETKSLTQFVVITIQAHAADTPRLIGSGAVNYRSLVAIGKALGQRAGFRVSIPKIKEPVVGEPDRYKFEADPQWPKDKIVKLLQDTAQAIFAGASEVSLCDDNSTDSTTMEVWVARSEATLAFAMNSSIATVFDAIGRKNGRLIYVDVVPKKRTEDEPPQPKTAAGRYAGEK